MILIDGFTYEFTSNNKRVKARYSDKHHFFTDAKWHIYKELNVKNIKLIGG